MKLTILCDNNTFIDSYLIGEPAFSCYIENEDEKILFDVGYSDVFSFNAKKRNINLKEVDKIILSHGHDDHTHGLKHFKFNKKTALYYCKGCFDPKKIDDIDLTAPFSEEKMGKMFNLVCVDKVTEISQNLYCLGPIPRVLNFEKDNPKLKTLQKGKWVQDHVYDDTALVYNGKNGLAIFTACSHSGVCNIIEYAKKTFGKKVDLLIGGFHMFDLNEQCLETIKYLKKQKINHLYPCHCTSLLVKGEMMKQGLTIEEVGSGLEIII